MDRAQLCQPGLRAFGRFGKTVGCYLITKYVGLLSDNYVARRASAVDAELTKIRQAGPSMNTRPA
jgi:hypothetical protein